MSRVSVSAEEHNEAYWLAVRHALGDEGDDSGQPTSLVAVHDRLMQLVIDLEGEIHGDREELHDTSDAAAAAIAGGYRAQYLEAHARIFDSSKAAGERAAVAGFVQRRLHEIVCDIAATEPGGDAEPELRDDDWVARFGDKDSDLECRWKELADQAKVLGLELSPYSTIERGYAEDIVAEDIETVLQHLRLANIDRILELVPILAGLQGVIDEATRRNL